MHGSSHRCLGFDTKGVLGDDLAHTRVQISDVAHPATQHNHIWVQQVHHLRQCATQTVDISVHSENSRRITLAHGRHDGLGRQGETGVSGVVVSKSGAAEPGFQAALLTTPTRRHLKL